MADFVRLLKNLQQCVLIIPSEGIVSQSVGVREMQKYLRIVVLLIVIGAAGLAIFKPFTQPQGGPDTGGMPLHQLYQDYTVPYEEARSANMPIFLEFYGEF